MASAHDHLGHTSISVPAPGQNEPPPSFFKSIDPALAHAFFSTRNGQEAFRHVESPAAFRLIEAWNAEEVQAFADKLRTAFYDRSRYIQPLASRESLYIYFDAHDIYYHGAQNLTNVIHHMWRENQRLYLVDADMTIPKIDISVQKALFNAENQTKLRNWNPECTPDILTVFTNGELGETHNLSETYNDTIRSILMNHWMVLCRGGPVKPEYQVKSDSFDSATCRRIVNGIVIADGTSRPAGQSIPSSPSTTIITETGLEVPPTNEQRKRTVSAPISSTLHDDQISDSRSDRADYKFMRYSDSTPEVGDHDAKSSPVHAPEPSTVISPNAPAASKDTPVPTNSPTNDVSPTFVGQGVENLQVPALMGPGPLPNVQNRTATEATPFYMQPNLASNLTSERSPGYLNRPWRKQTVDPSRFTPRADNGTGATRHICPHKIKPTIYCVNESKYKSQDPRVQTYDQCRCATCVERDHTVYIDGFMEDISEFTFRRLKYHFKENFGHTTAEWIVPSTRAMVIIFCCEHDALRAVNTPLRVPGMDTSSLRVGFRVGSQYFKPIHFRKAQSSVEDQRNLSYGPTHPWYQQASATAAGLATLGIGPEAVGPYRPESSMQDYYSGNQSSIQSTPDLYRHKSYPEKSTWMGSAAEDDRGDGSINDHKEMLERASRQLMQLLTPPDQQSPAEEGRPQVTAGHAEGQNDDNEVYDYGTMIVRPQKPKVKLPQAWVNSSPKTPPQKHDGSYQVPWTPKPKSNKEKDKARVGDGHGNDEGQLSAKGRLPWMSGASSRSRGSIKSTPRRQTKTPSPPLSLHSPNTPPHLPPFLSEEWLDMVNNVLHRMRMRRLTNYDVLLALRGRPNTDALFFQRNPIEGTEKYRRSFLSNLRRAFRGYPNNIIDFKLRRESPHPMSTVRRQGQRKQKQAIPEEESESSGPKVNDENKIPTPPPRMAQFFNPAATTSAFRPTGTARPKDASTPDDEAYDSDPFVDEAPTKGGNEKSKGHVKKNSREQLEKVTADLTGLRTKISPANFSGQSRQPSQSKANEYDGGIPLPATMPGNESFRNRRIFHNQRHKKSKSGGTSGSAASEATKPQLPPGQAGKKSGGKSGQEAKETEQKPSGRKEGQAGKEKGGNAPGQTAPIPKIVLPEAEWPTLSAAARVPNQEHRPASDAWASDPRSLTNQYTTGSRLAPSSSAQPPSLSSSNARPTGNPPSRRTNGHKGQNQQKKGGKKGGKKG
ncbi:hypothetical protein ABKA04_006999 [Annulohypoxylon sp. FPYF3050]